ncbi:MAG: hypothetical protein M1813_005626 [Trichoglossum hirsutum]|nr:MAG: hypothetical protein M1813_005626 [Trichoglossum hirsutum]
MASEDPSTFTGARRDLVTGPHNDKADLPEVVVGVRIEDVEDPPEGETFRAPPVVGGESDEQLREDLSERHVNMIAFSGTIGIGIFLTSGRILHDAGPGGAILAYVLTGTVFWSVIASLGEMTALMPVKSPIMEFATRYVDNAVGFATGWMYWSV